MSVGLLVKNTQTGHWDPVTNDQINSLAKVKPNTRVLRYPNEVTGVLPALLGERAGFVSRVGVAFQGMPDVNASATVVQGWETWYLGSDWDQCRAAVLNYVNPRNAGAAVGSFASSVFCADAPALAGREFDDAGNRICSNGGAGLAVPSLASGQTTAVQFQVTGPYLLIAGRNSDSGNPGPNVSPGFNVFLTLFY